MRFPCVKDCGMKEKNTDISNAKTANLGTEFLKVKVKSKLLAEYAKIK